VFLTQSYRQTKAAFT